jgi:hypothetical protein
VNLAGDDQADRKAHGGPDKVVYAYPVEDARWRQEQLGRSLGYGEFGENLSTEGIEVNDALVGERWQIGTTVLEVSEPRIPCWRLGFAGPGPSGAAQGVGPFLGQTTGSASQELDSACQRTACRGLPLMAVSAGDAQRRQRRECLHIPANPNRGTAASRLKTVANRPLRR